MAENLGKFKIRRSGHSHGTMRAQPGCSQGMSRTALPAAKKSIFIQKDDVNVQSVSRESSTRIEQHHLETTTMTMDQTDAQRHSTKTQHLQTKYSSPTNVDTTDRLGVVACAPSEYM